MPVRLTANNEGVWARADFGELVFGYPQRLLGLSALNELSNLIAKTERLLEAGLHLAPEPRG